jgi:hypothetical protein
MGLEVRKLMERSIQLITIMPAEPTKTLQERSGVAAFEE